MRGDHGEITVNDLGSVGLGGLPLEDLIGSPTQRLLLLALAVEYPSVVSDDRLTDLLWPGEAPRTRRLWDNVHRLRRVLDDVAPTVGIVRAGRGYALDRPAGLDSQRFEDLIARAEAVADAAPPEAVELLEAALELWRGPPFEGYDVDAFAPGLLVRLTETRRRAVVALARARIASGDASAAVVELEDLIEHHPFDEDLIALLVTVLQGAGRRVDALRRLRRFNDDLADQLGLQPGAELADLEARLLASSVSDGMDLGDTRHQSHRHVGNHERASAVAEDLPRWRSSFLGRRRVAARLGELVAANRLVSVVGPAGVGKTRLVVETVRRQLEVVDGEVRFVDLAVTNDPSSVDNVVAAAFGIRDASPRATLTQRLRRGGSLAILDNCEHLPEAVSDLVDHLLDRTSRTTLVVTSREPLRVGGEVILRLDPLDVDATVGLSPAGRLFAERAGLRPDDLPPRDLRLVQEIAGRLDGLPLAIELAAARASSMSLKDLVVDLDDRYHLLTRGERTGPDRHRTLQSAVDWSYDLLGRDLQATLTRCSTFAGPFTLDDAVSVCSDEALASNRVRSAVVDLVDASLITHADTNLPYRLLETLREYGRNELDAAGERAIWARRHGEYFTERAAHLATESYGPSENTVIDQLLAQSDEYRTAIHTLRDLQAWDHYAELVRALAITAFHSRGAWPEPVFLVADIALHPPDPAPPHWSALPAMVAVLLSNRGLAEEAEQHALLAIHLDPEWFRTWWSGAWAAVRRAPALAVARADMALALSDPESPDELLSSLNAVCLATRGAGDLDVSLAAAERMLVESRRFRTKRGEAMGWGCVAGALPLGAPGAAEAARKAFELGRASRSRSIELNAVTRHVRHLLVDDLDGAAEALAEYLGLPVIYSPPGFRVLGAATAYFAVAGDVDFARRLGNLLGRNNIADFAGHAAVDALLDEVPAQVDPMAVPPAELEATTALALDRLLG